jgi:GDP-4-dehydro-6-deoxy-D-mannose reductase
MRAFVTGAQGFVGPWLIDHLTSKGDEVATAGTDFDVTDGAVVRDALLEADPEVVYHLAAYSNVAASWSEPAAAFHTNTFGTSILLEAIRSVSPVSRVLLISSAEVYGAVPTSQLPITEEVKLTPVSPYAASKAAAEMLGIQAAVGFGLQVIRVRPFNHIGPGQSTDFVVSALARRIVQAKRDGDRAIRVGNLSARRDFTDVRDVVKAYRLLAIRGQGGKVYNICSGESIEIASIARQLIRLADADIVLERDESLFRQVDVAEVRGDPTRVREETGWRPEITLDSSLDDILDYWRDSSEPNTTTALT